MEEIMRKTGKQKGKIKRAFGTLILCWIFLIGIFNSEIQAKAATDSEILNSVVPIIFGCDENGEPVSASLGIPVNTQDRGVVIVSSEAYMGTCSAYIMSFYTENGSIMEIITPFAASEEYKTVFFSLQPDSVFAAAFPTGSMANITEDTELTQVLLSDAGELCLGSNYCVGTEGNFYKLAYSLEGVMGGSLIYDGGNGVAMGMVVYKDDGTCFVDMETLGALYQSGTNGGTGGSGGSGDAGGSGSSGGGTGGSGSSGGGAGGSGGSGSGSQSSGGGISSVGFWGMAVLVIIIVLVILVYNYTKKNKQGKSPQYAAEAMAGGVSIMGINGIHAGAVFPLDETLVFGRDAGRCNLVFAGGTQGISGVHCQVSPVAGGAQLMDMGSSYGTFLQNGTRLTPHMPYVLQKGEGFYLADRQYSYRIQ